MKGQQQGREFLEHKKTSLIFRALTRFMRLPRWIKLCVYAFPIVVLLEVYLLLGTGSASGSVAEPPGHPRDDIRVGNQEVEVLIEEKFSSGPRKVMFYEKTEVKVRAGIPATGYRSVVPATYRLPYELQTELPLTYHLTGNGKINGHETLPELAPPIRGLYHFLSLKTGAEHPLRALPESNVFEVKYEVNDFPLLDPKSGREFFSWTFPSPSRPVFSEQAKFVLVLPSYAKSEEVTFKTRRVQYGVTSDGFADLGQAYLSASKDQVEAQKTDGFVGAGKRVQLVVLAKELKPFEAVEVLVRW